MGNNQNDPYEVMEEAHLKLKDIKDIELFLKNFDDFLAKDEDANKKVSIRFKGAHYVKPEQKKLYIRVGVRFDYVNEPEDAKPILVYENEMAYEVINFQEIFPEKQPGIFSLSSDLLHELFSLGLATIRGILAEKTANTSLNGLYLPLMNKDQITGVINNVFLKGNH